MTELPRGHRSNLFIAAEVASLCPNIDPDNWNNDWGKSRKDILALKKVPLTALVMAMEENIP